MEHFYSRQFAKDWYFGSEAVLYDARRSIFGAFYSTTILQTVVFWTRNIVMRAEEFWSILQSRQFCKEWYFRPETVVLHHAFFCILGAFICLQLRQFCKKNCALNRKQFYIVGASDFLEQFTVEKSFSLFFCKGLYYTSEVQ